ncbi:hypothetical protein D3C81_2122890 [compost metagenome]
MLSRKLMPLIAAAEYWLLLVFLNSAANLLISVYVALLSMVDLAQSPLVTE